VATVNALQLEATRCHTSRQSLLATTPMPRFKSYPFLFYSFSTVYRLRYAITLTFDHVTLNFDLQHLYFIACDVIKLCQILAKASNPRGVWPYDLKHVSRAVVFITFKLTQPIRS